MARRILSAESVLTPTAQSSLQNDSPPRTENSVNSVNSVRTESVPAPPAQSPHADSVGLVAGVESRWQLTRTAEGRVLFDWEDRTALYTEIEFVNRVREKLDEAAVMIAPSMLRIVLTVKANVEGAKAQRAFLGEHVDWDFRRISELCIVAESFGLLDSDRREQGEDEIQRYGWSNALKLAYVPIPNERREIWERARGGREKASYRDVLEEIRRFRERKLIAGPAPLSAAEEMGSQLASVRGRLETLNFLSANLSSPDNCREALKELSQTQRELSGIKRALKERMESAETEALAALV